MSRLAVDKIIGANTESIVNVPGHVVQVVYGALDSAVTYSSDSNHDILSVSITPTSSSNKILLMGNFAHYINGITTDDRGDYEFKRGSTVVFETSISGSSMVGFGYFRDNGYLKVMNNTHNFLDSPATTSSVTYTMAHRPNIYGSGGQFGATVTNLTLMEISV